jgi:hypothetical protein
MGTYVSNDLGAEGNGDGIGDRIFSRGKVNNSILDGRSITPFPVPLPVVHGEDDGGSVILRSEIVSKHDGD